MKYSPALLLLVFNTNLFVQNHRYDSYDGPRSFSLGFKAILLGGLIWWIGMIIIMMHKKNEKGVVTTDAWTAKLGGIFAAIGALIVAFGLIMIGF